MAENLPQQTGQEMAASDSQVALDQHFARALSTKPSSPPCDCNPKPMEPFGGDPAHGTQVQRYYHNRNRVNILKRRIPSYPTDSMPPLLPKRQRFSFPHPRIPLSPQQYVMPPPSYYRSVPNGGMRAPMTPVSPNSCMMPPLSPNSCMLPPISPNGCMMLPVSPNGCMMPPASPSGRMMPHHMPCIMPQMGPNGCMMPPPMTPPPFQQLPGPGWYPHPPEHHQTPQNTRGGFVYPEFSQFLFHPEVDSFKDIPRLPGESFDDEEVVPDQSPVGLPHLTEQWGESWPHTTQANKDLFGMHVPFVPPPSSTAVAVMDSLRMTDQELDGILELNGEI